MIEYNNPAYTKKSYSQILCSAAVRHTETRRLESVPPIVSVSVVTSTSAPRPIADEKRSSTRGDRRKRQYQKYLDTERELKVLQEEMEKIGEMGKREKIGAVACLVDAQCQTEEASDSSCLLFSAPPTISVATWTDDLVRLCEEETSSGPTTEGAEPFDAGEGGAGLDLGNAAGAVEEVAPAPRALDDTNFAATSNLDPERSEFFPSESNMSSCMFPYETPPPPATAYQQPLPLPPTEHTLFSPQHISLTDPPQYYQQHSFVQYPTLAPSYVSASPPQYSKAPCELMAPNLVALSNLYTDVRRIVSSRPSCVALAELDAIFKECVAKQVQRVAPTPRSVFLFGPKENGEEICLPESSLDE